MTSPIHPGRCCECVSVRPVLQQRRPRATGRMIWARCRRCTRLTYAPTIARECDQCVAAAEKAWPGIGAVDGEVSGS